MRRSSWESFGARIGSGVTLCAALSLAVWLVPLSPAYGKISLAYGNDAEVEKPRRLDSAIQLAQNKIVVPSRVIKIPRGQTVFERKRPELEPLGVRLGAFILSPSLGVNEEYSDNIFTAKTGEIEDFITRVTPGVRLKSNWNNHSLSVFGRGEIGRHLNNSAEDYEDFTVGAAGTLDVRRDTKIRARVGMQNRHEERSSPDDVGGIEPTEIDAYIGLLEGFQRFNRLNFTLGASVERLDYDNATTGAGATINNNDRDRVKTEGSLRVGYEVVPGYEAFVRGAYSEVNYSDVVDDGGKDRDNQGYDVVAGVAVDFGGILFGDFFAGYMKREYDHDTGVGNLPKVQGPTVGADITWNMTPLTTFIGTIVTEIRESTLGAGAAVASGRIHTQAGVVAQHELLRNLLLGANVSYANDEYKGISRTDNVLRFGVNANYLIHRNLSVRGGYKYRVKNSDTASAEYVENVVFVGLRVQY